MVRSGDFRSRDLCEIRPLLCPSRRVVPKRARKALMMRPWRHEDEL